MPNKIIWTQDADNALQELKKAFTNYPSAPNFSNPFHIATDASEEAVGACLSQLDERGILRPVAFASAQLTPTQKNWPTIEREAFAIIWALKKCHTWLWSTEIRLETDHNPLVYVRKCTPANPKLVRWALTLERYNITIQHKKGILNTNADAMSRLPNGCWKSPNTSNI